MERRATAPLSGVRVADFGIFAAGPFCSMVLGDLGANVVRVEPLSGDPMRGYFRGYNAVNRGKRVIALDMKAPDGMEIVRRICAAADVVNHNYRPGVAGRLGIDGPTLRKTKPDTIVLEAPGYGVEGPKINEPAFDMVLQGYAGHELRLGGPGATPLWYRYSFVDLAGGMLGAVAVLEALFRRARTGDGATLSVCLLDAAIFLLSELVQDRDGRFRGADLLNPERTGVSPAHSLYQAADGWVAMVADSAAAADRLAEGLGLPEGLPRDPAAWGETQRAQIAAAVRTRGVEEMAALRDDQLWIEPCRRDAEAELLSHPVMQSLGHSFTSAHDTFGAVSQIAPVVSFSRSKVDMTGQGYIAVPGGDTRQILHEYGYQDAEIDDLYARKVVR